MLECRLAALAVCLGLAGAAVEHANDVTLEKALEFSRARFIW